MRLEPALCNIIKNFEADFRTSILELRNHDTGIIISAKLCLVTKMYRLHRIAIFSLAKIVLELRFNNKLARSFTILATVSMIHVIS